MSGDVPRPPGAGQDPPAVRHLRLVHPSPPRPTGPKRRHNPGPTFTPEEEARVRAALRRTRSLFGTWACLADALYLAPDTPEDVAAGRQRVSGDIVVRLAKALGKPVESLYRAPTDASTCAACGRRS